MVLRPFFSYYGAKWMLSRDFPAPGHNTIVEPFAGSAGYATRHHEREVVLVESKPFVAALWKWLTKVKGEEVADLPLVSHVDELGDVAPEARTLVGFWLNRGQSYPAKQLSTWGRSGQYPKSFWGEAIRDRIASQVEHIRHWKVIEGDYRLAPDVTATWFIDPPYQGRAGKHYRTQPLDYARLSEWVLARKGQVMACEGGEATWLPFRSIRAKKSIRHGTFQEAFFLREAS